VAEIDRIARRYAERDASSALSGFWTLRNPCVLHLAQERERRVLALLARCGADLSQAQLLDVGCGAGAEFAHYLRWGVPLSNVVGIDLMLPRLRSAHAATGGQVAQASGAALPFAAGQFDIVVQNAVFSSITEAPLRAQVAAEMLRVLRPGGWLLWYDAVRTRSRDPHFRAVPRAEVEALFPGVRWAWQGLSSDIGVAQRAQHWLGSWSLPVLDALRIFRTHGLGLGQRA
jgi:SAM-dependent methyltransferase